MRENIITEFKREYTEDIKYAVIAFANTDGGKIYIGIDDEGNAVGLERPDETMLRLTNMIRDAIRPDVTMFTECDVEDIAGKPVVVLSVQRGTVRPYYLAAKGIRPEGVYVRQGTSSVPASEAAILKMIKESGGDNYEDNRSLDQNLTFDEAKSYFAAHNILLEEMQMRSLHIIGDDATYTNLGMLLSDQCVHTTKLALFDGSMKSVFRDRAELGGSLFAQLEEAYSYIDKFNLLRAEFSGLERVERRNYPPEALREALLNAIIHRDYGFRASTLISIFDDRIEFLNVGGLVRGVAYDDIMLGLSVLRNQHLASIFHRLRLIEAYGTGILRIKECYGEYEQKPKFEITNNAFKVTLPNLNYTYKSGNILTADCVCEDMPYLRPLISDKQARREIVCKMAKNRGHIVRSDVENELGVSQATAILILRDMVEAGLLVKNGAGKRLTYRLPEMK